MKFLICLVLSIILVGCGKKTNTIIKEAPGPQVDVPGPSVEVEKKNPAEDFVGNWYGQDIHGVDSFISISMTADGLVEIESTDQILSSYNKVSKTHGTHPSISVTNLPVRDGKLLLLNKNFNYSSTTYDIEEDLSGNSITGNHRTDIVFELTANKELKITIKIFEGAVNTNVNKIIAKREFLFN